MWKQKWEGRKEEKIGENEKEWMLVNSGATAKGALVVQLLRL